MRRILVATLTALTVVIGLSAVLVGTASAATPVKSADSEVCLGLQVALSNALNLTVDNTDPEPPAVTQAVKDNLVAEARRQLAAANCGNTTPPSSQNCPRGEHWDSRDNRCERNDGNVGGGRYGSCADYNRNGIYDIRRGDSRYLDSWDRNRNGVACDRQDVIVSDDGRCVTFRDTNRDFGTRYNSTYNERIIRARSVNSDGGTRVTDSERRAIEDAADLRDFRSRWQTSSDELRTICNDPTPEVQIITVPAPAPVTVTAAPPPPPPVSSSGGSIPQGSVNTGGWSVAATLAHNHVA